VRRLGERDLPFGIVSRSEISRVPILILENAIDDRANRRVGSATTLCE